MRHATTLFASEASRDTFRRSVHLRLDRGGGRADTCPAVGGGPAGRVALAALSTHPLGSLQLPAALPLPPHTLPLSVARLLPAAGRLRADELCVELQTLGLSPLQFDGWWAYVRDHPCLEQVCHHHVATSEMPCNHHVTAT